MPSRDWQHELQARVRQYVESLPEEELRLYAGDTEGTYAAEAVAYAQELLRRRGLDVPRPPEVEAVEEVAGEAEAGADAEFGGQTCEQDESGDDGEEADAEEGEADEGEKTDSVLGYARAVRWARLTSFPDAGSAHVARLQLEAQDIPVYVDNENSAMMLWHLQPAVGGVRVCVPQEMLAEAREALQRPPAATDGEPPRTHDEGLVYSSLDRCPACHSLETEPMTWWLRVVQAVVIIMLGSYFMVYPPMMALVVGYVIYFLVTKPTHRCTRCGHRWKAKAIG